MTTFFLDVWQDLREKRLWPVAVGLLAAILAVPFVLFKPTSGPPAQAPQPIAAKGPQLPVVTVADGRAAGSDLGQFSTKNPFIPLSDLTAQAASGLTPAAPVTVAHASSSNGSPTAPPSAVQTSPASGGGSPATAVPPTSSKPSSSPTQPALYRYTVDLKFGAPGSLKTMKGVASLTLLPDAKAPVVMFMGVEPDGKSAVFFVDDSSYTASGNGACNTLGSDCRFVTLTSANSTETFDNGQTKYKLQLLSIGRQTLPSGGGSTKTTVTGASAKLDGYDASPLVPPLISLVDVGRG